MSGREIVVLPDADAVAEAAGAAWRSQAAAAVAARGRFRVLLSGGSTPKRLFQRLAAADGRDPLPWSATELFWGDERSVPADHPDANYRLAREALLDRIGPPAAQVHRLDGGRSDLPSAARDYEATVAAAFGIAPGGPPPAFDLVFLGLGTDAHTASLFPHTRALAERHHWFVANEVPQLATWRLTATFPLLDAAAAVVFLVAGADKASAVGAVFAATGDVDAAPARGVTGAKRVTWLLDQAAATGLPPAALGEVRHAR